MRLIVASIVAIAFVLTASFAETRALRDGSGASTGSMQSDGRGGYDLKNSAGGTTGYLKSDGRGGFTKLDSSGATIGTVGAPQ